MNWLLALFLAAQAADVASTAVRLRQGCHEALWQTQRPGVIAAGKGAGVVITYELAHRGQRKLAATIAVAGAVSGTFGTIHNLETSCR